MDPKSFHGLKKWTRNIKILITILCRGQAIIHVRQEQNRIRAWYMQYSTHSQVSYFYPATSSCWRYEQQTMLDYMQGWCAYELKSLNDAEKRAEICGIDVKDIRQDVKGIVLKHDLEQSQAEAEKVLLRGQWPRFYFTKKNGHGGIRRKTYLDNVDGRMVTNLWPYSEVGHTDEAKKGTEISI